MLQKLNTAENKYIDIEKELANPEIFSNQEEYTKLMKEYKALTPIIEKFREYKKTEKDMKTNAILYYGLSIIMTALLIIVFWNIIFKNFI